MNSQNNKVQKNIIILGVFLTLLAQMPLFRTVLGVDTKIVAYPVWMLIMVISFFPRIRYHHNELKFAIVFIVLFSVIVLFLHFTTPYNYFVFGNGDTFIIPLVLSLVMLLVGYSNAKLLDYDFFEQLARAYIVATVLLCIDVYFEYLRGVSLSTVTYAFSAKNSVGQMILTAIVLLLYSYHPTGLKKLIKIGLLIYLLVIIVLMRARASIASLAIIPLIYIFNSKIKLRYRVFISAGIVLFVFVLFSDQETYNFIVKNILFNITSGRSVTQNDLNYITSNRFEYFNFFSRVFPGNELTGIGTIYIDNMFLSALLNFGIIAGTLVILFASYPVVVAFKNKQIKPEASLTIKTIALAYFVNGFFEGLAPFGPGTKCFFLWFVIGSICNRESSLFMENLELNLKKEVTE